MSVPAVDQTDRLSSDAVQALHEAHSKELLAFLIGVLRDASAAQDVSQITFRRVLETGHTAREETMKGWLFKVALREALVYRRQYSTQERHQQSYFQHREVLSAGSTVEDKLADAEDVNRLKELIGRLPVEQQVVLRQRIYDERTFVAIASDLGLPLGTVLTRMRIAVQRIREWFGEVGDSERR